MRRAPVGLLFQFVLSMLSRQRWGRSAVLVAVVAVAGFAPTMSPLSADSSFEVPDLSYVTGTVAAGPLTPAVHLMCLARSEAAGPQVTQILLCYQTSGAQPVPPPPPPPYRQAIHQVLVGEFDGATGELTVPVVPCAEFVSGLMAIKVDLAVQIDKGGGPASGSTILITDTTAPLDCAAGTQTTGPLTLTPLAQSHDEDQDGCTDWEELGDNEVAGGLRDPFNFWDFYDVPTGTWPNLARNASVSALDFFAVLARYNTEGDPDIDPLSLPPATGYHPAFDRSAAGSLGPDAWNIDKADGAISGLDMFAILAQVGHYCTEAP